MKTKNLLVTFVMALFLVSTVSAVSNIADTSSLEVTYDDMFIYGTTTTVVSVVSGEDATFKVYFIAAENDTDVTVEATLDTGKKKVYASTGLFDVEKGKSYRKVLTLKVPEELKDEISKDIELSIEIDGKTYKTQLADIYLRVQRPSYEATIKSVVTPSTISAGESFPIEIVLKNTGYNDLDDVYVTASINGLNIYQGPKWFGDIANLESCSNDCEKEDTVYGKLTLNVPYDVQEGVYTLSVIVQSEDTKSEVVKQIRIENALSQSVYSAGLTKTIKAGESTTYDLLIVNPTNNVKVYTLLTESKDLTSSVSQSIVAIPAGSSKVVEVSAASKTEGTHEFSVNIISGNVVENKVTYQLNVEGKKGLSSVTILTIVLVIIFLALLATLIVLLGKKPEKSEELGESYY